jgi:uncharacterized protein
MIVDCHTKIWRSPEQLGRGACSAAARPSPGAAAVDASPELHLTACEPVDKAIVLGFRSSFLEANVPNDFISEHVRAHRSRLIGFAGIDPAEPVEALDEVARAKEELGLSGIAVAPAAQDFHPASTGALRVFAEAGRLGLPVLFHHGACGSPSSKMEYARPFLLDEVARELPALKIIVAQLGYPWVDECVALLSKQPNVYADISGLAKRPWCAYNALLLAREHGVMDKLLFGSGFPFSSAATSIEALYSINQLTLGTNLPTIPRELLRAVVECNALEMLGIASARPGNESSAPGSVFDDDI